MNLARLFSYTRLLEAQLAREREERADEVVRVEQRYNDEIARLVSLHEQEARERRLLQDRLLQKSGSLPVFEEPRQTPPRADRAEVTTGTALKRTLDEGRKRADAIHQDVQAFIKEQGADAQPPSG